MSNIIKQIENLLEEHTNRITSFHEEYNTRMKAVNLKMDAEGITNEVKSMASNTYQFNIDFQKNELDWLRKEVLCLDLKPYGEKVQGAVTEFEYKIIINLEKAYTEMIDFIRNFEVKSEIDKKIFYPVANELLQTANTMIGDFGSRLKKHSKEITQIGWTDKTKKEAISIHLKHITDVEGFIEKYRQEVTGLIMTNQFTEEEKLTYINTEINMLNYMVAKYKTLHLLPK